MRALLIVTVLALSSFPVQAQSVKENKLAEIDKRIADLQKEIDALKSLRNSIASGQLPDSALEMIVVRGADSVQTGTSAGPAAGTSGNLPESTSSSPARASGVKKNDVANSSSLYQTGPRGGCYTVSASGKKRYVDRSLCR